MNATTLPTEVVEQDRQLDTEATASQLALAEHRWHWTADEENSGRVSAAAYARQVGVSAFAVRKMVRGFVAWRERESDIDTRTLTDFAELAQLGEEKQMVVEEIARLTGRSPSNVAANHRGEVTQALDIARERAERRGTTVAEEIPGAVADMVKSREAARKLKEKSKSRRSMRFIEVEGHIAAAAQRLRRALDTAKEVDFDDEEVELLTASLRSLRAMLDLLDLRFSGAIDVDWDAEMAALNG